jgi:hypothetical protein
MDNKELRGKLREMNTNASKGEAVAMISFIWNKICSRNQ